MANSRSRLWRGKKFRAEEERRQELESSLKQTQLQLAQAYAGFNSTADQDLVESYIYEIQALQARYSYLLRQRKAMEPSPPVLPAEPAPSPALPVV